LDKRSQRRFSTEEKYKILQEGESGSMSINEVCRRHGVTTAAYYTWRKQAQSAMKDGLANKRKKNEREQHLEAEIKRLKNTIVEITQENVELKKKYFE